MIKLVKRENVLFKVLTTLCIIFTTEAFYPKDPKTGFSDGSMTFAVYTLILSLFSGSFGMTKFFLKGPLAILPLDAPLAGVLSFKFITLLLLNTMFVVRTLCLEASLFTTYRSINYGLEESKISNIDPLIPEEYRLVIYLLPALLSFTINLVRLACSMKSKNIRYFKSFPQFILCPMFCPLMFEGDPDQKDDNELPVRVWKIGSIVNSFFIGCLPQILMVAMEQYRLIPSWYQFQNRTNSHLPENSIYNHDSNWYRKEEDGKAEDSNALIKYPYGNTIFAISFFVLYLFLTTIFFSWSKIFKDGGSPSNFCKSICPPCPNPCHKPQSEESDPSSVKNQDDLEEGYKLVIRDPPSTKSIQDIEGEDTNAEVLIKLHYAVYIHILKFVRFILTFYIKFDIGFA